MELKDRLALTYRLGITLIHVFAIYGLFQVSWTLELFILFIVTYQLKALGITVGFHRLFSHSAFKINRVGAFVLCLMGTFAGQGPLKRWVFHHRAHHRFSDKKGDPHSPHYNNFYYGHVGWLFNPDSFDDSIYGRDFLKLSPEVEFISNNSNKIFLLQWPLLYLIGGADYVWVGFVFSTVAVLQSTFLVNSLCHVRGSRPYETKDGSRNNWLVVFLTNGEGWHNNHHYRPSSAIQGFDKGQIDVSGSVITLLEKLGIAWDVKRYIPGDLKTRNESLLASEDTSTS